MPTKNQTRSNDKASSNLPLAKEAAENPEMLTAQQPSPAIALQRARLASKALTSADTLQLQRTLGNQAVGKLVYAGKSGPVAQTKPTITPLAQREATPAAGVVQRTVTAKRSPEALPTVTDDVLKEAYNAAWSYLWDSENARKIYKYVEDKTKTDIEVGSTDSDAEVGKVRWNPWEYNVQLDQPNLPGQVQANGQPIDYSQVTGISSSAITLLHEVGHIKQHDEAAKADATVDAGGSDLSSNLAELVRKVYSLTSTLLSKPQKDQLLTDRLVVEEDNVTRHERPAAAELPNEPERTGYTFSGPNANAAQYYDQTTQDVLGEIDALPDADRVETALTRHTTPPPAVAITARGQFQSLLDEIRKNPLTRPKFQMHKVNQYNAITAKLQSYIDAMDALEQSYAGTNANDPSLKKPVW